MIPCRSEGALVSFLGDLGRGIGVCKMNDDGTYEVAEQSSVTSASLRWHTRPTCACVPKNRKNYKATCPPPLLVHGNVLRMTATG